MRDPVLMPGYPNSRTFCWLKTVKGKDTVAEVRPAKSRGGSYVLQYIKCGKPTCRCAKGGKLHGPYWYLYTKKDGKTTCKYIGKELPGEA